MGVMRRKTLFVGGLGRDTNEAAFRMLFQAYEPVEDTRLMLRKSGECRGFGYVTLSNEHAAREAVHRLDGSALSSGTLRVTFA